MMRDRGYLRRSLRLIEPKSDLASVLIKKETGTDRDVREVLTVKGHE